MCVCVQGEEMQAGIAGFVRDLVGAHSLQGWRTRTRPCRRNRLSHRGQSSCEPRSPSSSRVGWAWRAALKYLGAQQRVLGKPTDARWSRTWLSPALPFWNCRSSPPPAARLFWVSLPYDLTFPFGKAVGAVGSHWPGKRYGGASVNLGP